MLNREIALSLSLEEDELSSMEIFPIVHWYKLKQNSVNLFLFIFKNNNHMNQNVLKPKCVLKPNQFV